MYLLAANAVLILHFTFVCFVILGAMLTTRWPRIALAHIPAALWGFLVEAFGWYCPLTDLENELLRRAGESSHASSFVDRCLLTVLYPENLTRGSQLLLAAAVLTINAALYARVVFLRRRI